VGWGLKSSWDEVYYEFQGIQVIPVCSVFQGLEATYFLYRPLRAGHPRRFHAWKPLGPI